MAEDWAADVRRYVPDADPDIIAGLVRYCGIALRNRDSALVSFSDATETDRVKANFLRKKLGLTDTDDVLDAAIAAVGERMSDAATRNRVTVYYLLAQAFGRLEDFRPKGAAAGRGANGEAAAMLPLDAEPVMVPEPVMAPPPAAPAPSAPAPSAAAPQPASRARPLASRRSDWGLLAWPLTAALVLFTGIAALIGFGGQRPALPAAMPAAQPVPVAAVPDGAGLVREERAGQPVLIVYFAVGKADVAPGFAEQAGAVKAWAASHPGSKYVISGYNDPSGNAALNAQLSKNRAQAVQAALVATGVAEADTLLEKPAVTTDTVVTAAQARRVEIIVR